MKQKKKHNKIQQWMRLLKEKKHVWQHKKSSSVSLFLFGFYKLEKLNNCFNPTSESLTFQKSRVNLQQSFLHCAIGPLAALTQTISVRAVWIFPACPGSLSAAVCLKSSSCWIHAYAIFNFKYKNKKYSCAPTFR